MTIIIIIVAIVLLFGLYLFTRKSKLKDQELTKNSLAEKNGYSSSIQGEYYYNTEQGKLSYKNGTYNEALIYFENAFKLIPEPLVVIQLAGCNLKLGNIEKALGLCTEVINSNGS